MLKMIVSIGLALLALHGQVPADTPAPALVTNGGFEELVRVTMGELVGWRTPACGASTPSFSPFQYRGERAIVLEGDGQRYALSQRLDAPQAKAFVLTAAVKAEEVVFGPDGYAQIEAVVNYDHILKSHYFLRIKAGTYDWTELRFIGMTIQGIAVTSIDLNIEGRLETGRLHVDELSIVQDDSAATPAAMLTRKVQDLADSLETISITDETAQVAKQHINKALKAIRDSPEDLTTAHGEWQKSVSALSHEAFAAMYPEAMTERPVEARLIYHGTAETRETTDAHVKKIVDGRFNAALLSLGTWDSVVYKSDVIKQIPAYREFDTLNYFIDKAKDHDIKVFGYLAGFYGLSNRPTDPQHVVNQHPDWFATNPHDPGMHVFPDPANPEAVDYIASLYVDLISRFELDGVGLDYIRYPDVHSLNYDERNRRAILKRFGIDILAEDPTKNPDHWAKIQIYRADQIDHAIEKIKQRVQEVKPGLPVIASLISERDLSAKGVGQDWTRSSRLLDYSSPMNYDDVSLYEDLLNFQRSVFADNRSVFIPAIGGMPRVQDSWTLTEWAHRIAVQRKIGCEGVAVYRVAELDPAVAMFLGKGPFYYKAAFPASFKANIAPLD